MGKMIIFVIGFLLVIFGVTWVFKEWAALVLVFKGVVGALLAVVGLVVLFAATIKS